MDISLNPLLSPGAAQTASLNQAEMYRRGAEASSFASVLEKARETGDDAALKKACLDFESYFMQIMFREMRKTSFAGENGVPRAGRSEAVFRDMLDEEYAKSAAETGGIGLAEMMYKNMKGTASHH